MDKIIADSRHYRVLRLLHLGYFRLGCFCFGLLGVLSSIATGAHPIPVIYSSAYVTRGKATIQVDIFVEDLDFFHNLSDENDAFISPEDVRRGIELHKQFLLDHIILRDVDGKKFKGAVTDVVECEMEPQGVSVDRLMEFTVSYQLEYLFDNPPEFITFVQDIGAELLIPSEMHLRVKQEGRAPQKSVLRPEKPFSVRFDWEAPALSEEASDDEWKKWLKRQREETLGITSYSAVYSFLYITRHEVRHEILIPLASLESGFRIPRADSNYLEVEEQEAGQEYVTRFFEGHNPIKIDGVEVVPKVDRVDFYALSLKDFAMRAKKRRVSAASCRVGIILSYATVGPPKQVELKWDKFNDNFNTVDCIVFAYDDVKKHEFSKFVPEDSFVWSGGDGPPLPEILTVKAQKDESGSRRIAVGVFAMLAVLVVGTVTKTPKPVMLGGAGIILILMLWRLASGPVIPPVTDQQAKTVFSTLHKNIYRAFTYRDEDDIYEAITKSVSGELARDLYLQINRGLIMQEQGGAVSKVDTVKLLDGKRVDDEGFGFSYLASWTVDGTVEHWGHIHSRLNQYQAEFKIEPIDDSWKISKLEVLNEESVRFRTRMREFNTP